MLTSSQVNSSRIAITPKIAIDVENTFWTPFGYPFLLLRHNVDGLIGWYLPHNIYWEITLSISVITLLLSGKQRATNQTFESTIQFTTTASWYRINHLADRSEVATPTLHNIPIQFLLIVNS